MIRRRSYLPLVFIAAAWGALYLGQPGVGAVLSAVGIGAAMLNLVRSYREGREK